MRLSRAVVLSLAFGASATALASPSPSPTPSPEAAANPCRKLESACKAAGYSTHEKGASLEKDCMQPLLSGGKVPGVQGKEADIRACDDYRKQQQK
jgi:hypothetical protein